MIVNAKGKSSPFKSKVQRFHLPLVWALMFLAVESACSEAAKLNTSVKLSLDNHDGDDHELSVKFALRTLDDTSSPLTYSVSVAPDYSSYNISFSKNITIVTLNENLFSISMPGLVSPDDYTFNVSRLDDGCSVQINFNFTITITSQEIIITFNHNNSFQDADPSDPLSTTVVEYVPFELGISASMVNYGIITGIKIIFGISAGSLLICFYTQERATIFWSMIDFLQMIYGLFFINTELPWVLRSVVIGSSVSTLTFVPSPFSALNFPPNNSTSYMFGPDQVSFLFCMWPWLLMLIGIGTFQAIICIVYRLTKIKLETQIKLEPFLNLVHWSGLIRLFMVAFLPLLIAMAVQFALLSNDPILISGAVVGGATGLAFAIIAIFMLRIVNVNKEKLREEKYRARFIVLYEGQKLRKRITKYWFFVDLIRKVIYCAALGACYTVPLAQTIIILALNTIYFLLFGAFRPFLRAKYNAIISIREGLLIAVNGTALTFVLDDQTGFLNTKRLYVGWVAVICAGIIYVIHGGWFVLDALISLNKKKTPLTEEDSTPRPREDDSTPRPREDHRIERLRRNPDSLNQSQQVFIGAKRKNEDVSETSQGNQSANSRRRVQTDNVPQDISNQSRIEAHLSDWHQNPNTDHFTLNARVFNLLKAQKNSKPSQFAEGKTSSHDRVIRQEDA